MTALEPTKNNPKSPFRNSLNSESYSRYSFESRSCSIEQDAQKRAIWNYDKPETGRSVAFEPNSTGPSLRRPLGWKQRGNFTKPHPGSSGSVGPSASGWEPAPRAGIPGFAWHRAKNNPPKKIALTREKQTNKKKHKNTPKSTKTPKKTTPPPQIPLTREKEPDFFFRAHARQKSVTWLNANKPKTPEFPLCPHPGLTPSTLHRAPVGQGPSGHGWLAIAFGFWSGRALATGTAWAGLCLIYHHHYRPIPIDLGCTRMRLWQSPS